MTLSQSLGQSKLQSLLPPPAYGAAKVAKLKAKAAKRSLVDDTYTLPGFIREVNPRYEVYRHCQELIGVLEKVVTGEIDRLMVFMPPRHSKSETVSRLFSSYYLRRHPDRWVGVNSYAADLAYTLSRNARENFVTAGGQLSGSAKAVKHWETRQGGGMWAAGVGGGITGKGFHCLPKCAIIETEIGNITIGRLYDIGDPISVKSFNHSTGKIEYKPISAYTRRQCGDFVRITLSNGKQLVCTPEHPVYVDGKGYIGATDVQAGDTVFGSRSQCLQNPSLSVKIAIVNLRKKMLRLRRVSVTFVRHAVTISGILARKTPLGTAGSLSAPIVRPNSRESRQG